MSDEPTAEQIVDRLESLGESVESLQGRIDSLEPEGGDESEEPESDADGDTLGDLLDGADPSEAPWATTDQAREAAVQQLDHLINEDCDTEACQKRREKLGIVTDDADADAEGDDADATPTDDDGGPSDDADAEGEGDDSDESQDGYVPPWEKD